MNSSDYIELLDIVRRRQLIREEQAELEAFFSAHPQKRLDWEEEMALNRALVEIPDIAVATNFTARVMQAVQKEPVHSSILANCRSGFLSLGWVPKAALAVLMASLAFLTYHQHRAAKRVERAQSVAAVSEVASSLPIEMLRDYEAIQKLRYAPKKSEDSEIDFLLTALP